MLQNTQITKNIQYYIKNTKTKIYSKSFWHILLYIIICISFISLTDISINKIFNGRLTIKTINHFTIKKYNTSLKFKKMSLNFSSKCIKFYKLKIGNNFIQTDMFGMYLNFLSLFKHFQIDNIIIENIKINLHEIHMSKVRQVKTQKNKKTVSRFHINQLNIKNGDIYTNNLIPKIPLNLHFNIFGKGWTNNQMSLKLDIYSPSISKNALSCNINFNHEQIEINKSLITIGNNNYFAINAALNKKTRIININTTGKINITNDLLVLPQNIIHKLNDTHGLVAFHNNVYGHLDNIKWSNIFYVKHLINNTYMSYPGDLISSLNGNNNTITINDIQWRSKNINLKIKGDYFIKQCYSNLQFNTDHTFSNLLSNTKFNIISNHIKTNIIGNIHLPIKFYKKHLLTNIEMMYGYIIEDFLNQNNAKNGHLITIINHNPKIKNIYIQTNDNNYVGNILFNMKHNKLNSIHTSMKLITNIKNVMQLFDRNNTKYVKNINGKTYIKAEFKQNSKKQYKLYCNALITKSKWNAINIDKIQANIAANNKALLINNIKLNNNIKYGYGYLDFNILPTTKVNKYMYDIYCKISNLSINTLLHKSHTITNNNETDNKISCWIHLCGPYKNTITKTLMIVQHINYRQYVFPLCTIKTIYNEHTNHIQLQNIKIDKLDTIVVNTTPKNIAYGFIDIDLKYKKSIFSLNSTLINAKKLRINRQYTKPNINIHLHNCLLPQNITKIDFKHFAIANHEKIELITNHHKIATQLKIISCQINDKIYIATNNQQNNVKKIKLKITKSDTNNTLDIKFKTHNILQRSKRSLQNPIIDINLNCQLNIQKYSWQSYIKTLYCNINNLYLFQKNPIKFNSNKDFINIHLDMAGIIDSNYKKQLIKNESLNNLLTIKIIGNIPFSNRSHLNIHTSGNINLSNLQSAINNNISKTYYALNSKIILDGLCNFNTQIIQSLKNTHGIIQLKDGKITSLDYPLINIDNINFDALIDDIEILAIKYTPITSIVSQGKSKIWGNILLYTKNITFYNLYASINNFYFIDSINCLELQGNLNSNFTGNTIGGILKSDITAQKATYKINTSELFVNNKTNKKTANTKKDSYPSKFILDLETQVIEPIDIDANFLRMQWISKDPIKIKGTIKQPIFISNLELLPNSKLTIPAGDIIFNKGYIISNNTKQASPKVSIIGQINIEKYTITIHITKDINKWNVQLTSIPSLNQDQIAIILSNPAAASTINSNIHNINNNLIFQQTIYEDASTILSARFLAPILLSKIQENLREVFKLDRINVSLPYIDSHFDNISVRVDKDIKLFNYHLPIIFTHHQIGNEAITSGQIEWYMNDFTLRIGTSSDNKTYKSHFSPLYEIHHTWRPK